MINFLNANPDIPLGTNLFPQNVNNKISTIEFVDTINVSTSLEIYPNYIMEFIDNIKVSEDVSAEITNEKTMSFIDDITINHISEIVFNPQHYEISFRDDIQIIDEGYMQTFSEIIFENNITISDEFSIINTTPVIVMEFTDDIYAYDEHKTFYYNDQKGDIVLENTIRNKYAEESFADFTVTPNKSYIYTFRTYNDFGRFTDLEKEITVSNEEILNQVGVANIRLSNTNNKVKILISDPNDSSWIKTEIYRSLNPINDIKPEEKILSYTVKNQHEITPFVDTVEFGKTYYYKAFTYSNNTINKTGENKSITIKIPSEVIPPSPINNLSMIPENNAMCYLNWNDPPELDWIKTVIVRKENEPPLNPNDGTIMTINTERDKYATRLFEVSTPVQDTKYYFKAFPYNNSTYNHLGNYVEVQTKDIYPPDTLIHEKINYVDYKVNILFYVPDKTTKGIKIRRSESRDEMFRNKGEEIIDLIANGTGEYIYTDYTASSNKQYYYKCYPYDEAGNINDYGRILECFTLDTRIPNITNLKVEQLKEDLIFTWTNPNNQYFLNTEIYYSLNPINETSEKILLGSNSTIGNVKLTKSIHELSNHGNLYFMAIVIDYKGNKYINSTYNVQKYVEDTTPPDNISEFNVIQNEGNLQFTWISPDNIDWQSETLVYKKDSEPVSILDGQSLTVITNKNDHAINPFTYNIGTGNYFFKVFPKDKYGNINNICMPIVVSYDKPIFNEGATNLSLELIRNDVAIKWNDPNDSLWGATKVIKNDRYIPTDHNDGEIVIVNTERNKYSENAYIDKNLILNARYHYAIYTRDKNGVYSDKVIKESILIRDNIPPSAVGNLNIEKLDNGIGLTWKDTNDYDWKGVKLVKNTSIPQSDSDGELLINSNIRDRFENTPFVDNNIETGKSYYYRTFTYDIYGNTTPGNYVNYILEDTTPPGIAINFHIEQAASTNGARLLFKWQDPSDSDWKYTKICYNTSEVTQNDTEIIRNTQKDKYLTKPFETLLELTPGLTYNFKAFTYDFNENVNTSGQTLSLTIMDNVNIGNSVIKGQYNDYVIELNIDDDQTKDFDGCMIIKSTKSIGSINDGEVLMEYTTPDKYSVTKLIDREIQPFNEYHYQAFPYKMFGSTKIYNNNCNEISITVQSITPPVSAPLSAIQNGDHIYLDWEIPEDSTFAECYVVKNTNHMPVDENDGELIVHNIGGYRVTWYKDYDILPSTKYYYRTFTLDKYGNWNRTYEGLSITTSEVFPMTEIDSLKVFHYINKDKYGFNSGKMGIGVTWDDPNSESWVETNVMFKLNGTPTINDSLLVNNKFADRYKDNFLNLVNGGHWHSFGSQYEDKTYHFKAFPKDSYGNVLTNGNDVTFKISKDYYSGAGYRDKYANIFSGSAGDFSVGSNGIHYINDQYIYYQAWYNKYGSTSGNKIIRQGTNVFYNKQMSFLEYYKAVKNGEDIFASTYDSVLVSKPVIEFNPDIDETLNNQLILDPYLVKGKVNVITPSIEFNVSNYNEDKIKFKVQTYSYDKKPNTCIPVEDTNAYAYYEFDENYIYILFVDAISASTNYASYYSKFGFKTSINGEINWLFNEYEVKSPYYVDFFFDMGVNGISSIKNPYHMYKIPKISIPSTIYLTGTMYNVNNPNYSKEYPGCNITIKK